MTQFWL